MAPLAELRRRIGPNLSDEEFLLRATMPAGLIDAMQPPGVAPRRYDPEISTITALVRELTARRDIAQIAVDKPGFHLALKRNRALEEA
jgi:oxaloacetate decarboxylase alpha subunit